MFKPTLLIDFDGTITKNRGFGSEPDAMAVDAINKLKEFYKIIIFSCRANKEYDDEQIELEDYLKRYNIHYDEICQNKPAFFMLIDDRSMNPKIVNWDEIIKKLVDNIN